MIEVLIQAEKELPALLREPTKWQSLFVDYHEPFVERLWCNWRECRLYLHRIHSCAPGKALFHPHPWPSAMRVLSGTYEMAIGYGVGNKEPPPAARLLLGPGSLYEMTDPNGWHYVRPIGEPTLSLMVTGKPWTRSTPKSDYALQSLKPKQKAEIFEFFRSAYK
jgi:hypothetical protein